jgi:UDP-glucose 4-epimerase
MNVLVTGATGVLGAHVLRRLLEQGEQVLGTSSRADTTLLGDLRGATALERADVRDTERMELLLARHRAQTVVHLAAVMPAACKEDPARAVDVNVTATAALYAAAARTGVERFVYASSKSAYGPELPAEHGPPEYKPITEDTPAKPVWMYDVTKRAGELVIEAQRRRGGPESTSLRFATVYGPGKGARYGGASALSSLIEAAIDGRAFKLARGGDQVDDVIWVGDAADGVARAARHRGALQPIYNISTGAGIAIGDFARAVASKYPQAQLDIGPGLQYMGTEPTYGVLDATRARRDLGFDADPDPVRGAALFDRALAELRRTD